MFSSVPDDWTVAELRYFLGWITYGFTNPMPTTDRGPLKLTAKDIEDGKIAYSTARHTSEEAFRKLTDKSKPRINDVLLTKDGTLGRVAVVDRSNVCINQSIALLRSNKRIDPYFLKYLLRAPYYQNKMEMDASGTTIKHIYITKIDKMKVAAPPVDTQRKIVGILKSYDDLVDIKLRCIQILEEIVRNIYDEWFVHFRYPGHENEEVIKTKEAPMPATWKLAKLSEVCSLITDGTHDTPKPVEKEGFFLVMGKHIKNGFIDFSTCYKISKEDHEKVIQRSKPEKGDILFTNIGTLGNTALVDQEFEFSIKNVALFKPLKPYYSKFLLLHLSSRNGLESLLQRSSGTSQKFLGLSILRNSSIIFPEDTTLLKLDEIIDPIFSLRSILWKQIQVLKSSRDLLLPKLVSGEIDVNNKSSG